MRRLELGLRVTSDAGLKTAAESKRPVRSDGGQMHRTTFAASTVLMAAIVLPAQADVPWTGSLPQTANPAPDRRPALQHTSVDPNAATSEELAALPGVDPARAKAIVKGRPYRSLSELHRRAVIPMPVYLGIRNRLALEQEP